MTTERNAQSPLVFGIPQGRKTMIDCDLYLIQIPDIFLACFSVMSPESFDNIDAKWPKEVRHHSQAPLMLVGTKSDLRDDEAELDKLKKNNRSPVAAATAQRYAKENGFTKYMECSAKNQKGLKDVFDEAIKIVLNKDKQPKKQRFCRLL